MKTQNISADPQQSRIQMVSGVVRSLFLMALVIEGLGMAASVMVFPYIVSHLTEFGTRVGFNNCSGFLVLPLAFMVTVHFFRFFSRLRNGCLFDSQTVRHLERAGKWWIALGVVQLILQSVEASTFNPNNIIITGGSGIVAGLIVYFIAWVFRAGMKLKNDQELTALVYRLASNVACKIHQP